MNKAILLGNVGRDPEIRYVDTRPVATFSLATTERGGFTPGGARLPDRTEWHNIVMWDGAALTAEKYIRRGTRLLVEGRLRTRYWEDRNAQKHTVTEVLVDTFELLGRQSEPEAPKG